MDGDSQGERCQNDLTPHGDRGVGREPPGRTRSVEDGTGLLARRSTLDSCLVRLARWPGRVRERY